MRHTLSWHRSLQVKHGFPVGSFTMASLLMSFLQPWWLPFLLRSLWVFLCLFLSIQCAFFPLVFKFYSLSLFVSNFIMMYVGVVFFLFLLLEIHWSSWISRFKVSSSLKKFWPLFLQIFSHSFLFLLSPPSGTLIRCILGCLTLSHETVFWFLWFTLLCL